MAGKPDGFGDKQLHIGAASVEPGTGAVRGFYAGQDYLDSQLNWAVAGGQAGSTFKPFALATGLKQGYSLKSTFEGNSPIEVGDAEIENQGDHDYGVGGEPAHGHRGLHQHRLHRPHHGARRRPRGDHRDRQRDGHPAGEGQVRAARLPEPHAGPGAGDRRSRWARRPSARSTWRTATRRSPNGGVAAEPFIIEKVVDADGETQYEHKVEDATRRSARTSPPTSPTRMQQVVESGSGTAALGARPAGCGQDRHRHQDRRRGVVVVVRGLHPADGDRGDVRPRRRQRPARRLAAVATSAATIRPRPGPRS